MFQMIRYLSCIKAQFSDQFYMNLRLTSFIMLITTILYSFILVHSSMQVFNNPRQFYKKNVNSHFVYLKIFILWSVLKWNVLLAICSNGINQCCQSDYMKLIKLACGWYPPNEYLKIYEDIFLVTMTERQYLKRMGGDEGC